MFVSNKKISSILYSVADYLSIMGENPFRIRAYRNAASTIEDWPEELATIYFKNKDLPKIPGIGHDLSGKVIEIISSGKLSIFEKLKKTIPESVLELLQIGGLGPVKVKALWNILKIQNIEQLKKKVIQHEIQNLPGFGRASESKLLDSIKIHQDLSHRFLWIDVEAASTKILEYLKSKFSDLKIEIAGSFRRAKDVIGDIDLLVASNNPVSELMSVFKSYPDSISVIISGSNRSSMLLNGGIQVDLRIVPEESFASALLYFTGSKSHNIAIRKIAVEKKMLLNEYGLFQNGRNLFCKSENEIYDKLGMKWIPPEIREGQDEILASLNDQIPRLILKSDIKGDLHLHSNYSDGILTLNEVASAAIELGYEYVAITDHSRSLKIANGLDDKRFLEQFDEINEFNDSNKSFHLFKSGEISILEDGSLDVSSQVLAEMDFAIIAIHDHFSLSKSKQTLRIKKAMDFDGVKILAHPTGKLLGIRNEINLDFDDIVKHALQRNCYLELNCQPTRMDLNEQKCRYASSHHVRLVISTDSHRKNELRFMDYGVRYARRGWVEPSHVLNTESIVNLKKIFRK